MCVWDGVSVMCGVGVSVMCAGSVHVVCGECDVCVMWG